MKFQAFLAVSLYIIQGCTGFRVVCVYTNWSQYRPTGGTFLPEDVDPSLCTHIIYVYAKLKGNRLAAVEWNDDGTKWADGMYQRVNNLKDQNPELKTLLGVGGWMMGSKDFSRLAAGRGSRKVFARTTVKFLRDRNFDGLTIDWQHPTKRGGRAKDRENYSLLLKEIRKAFDDESKKSRLPPLLLTAGVSASRDIIDNAYEVDNITRYTDFVNVMAYDLHGDWDNYTGHPSQLYPREEEFGPSTEVNVDASMRHWMSLVPDRKKLIMGVSTYGRTFTLRKARHHEYNVPSTGPGLAGEFTQQPGMLAYYERCSQFMDAPRVWDPVSQVSYWYSGDQWVAGEDIESIRAKVNWTRTYQIGGMMIWSLDTDDSKDTCFEGPFSLLSTVSTELQKPLDPTAVVPNVVNQDQALAQETPTPDTPPTVPTKPPTKKPPPKKDRNTAKATIKKATKAASAKKIIVQKSVSAKKNTVQKSVSAKKTTVQSKTETKPTIKQSVITTKSPVPVTKQELQNKRQKVAPRKGRRRMFIRDKQGRRRLVRRRRPSPKQKKPPVQNVIQAKGKREKSNTRNELAKKNEIKPKITNNKNVHTTQIKLKKSNKDTQNSLNEAPKLQASDKGLKNGKIHDEIKSSIKDANKLPEIKPNTSNIKQSKEQSDNKRANADTARTPTQLHNSENKERVTHKHLQTNSSTDSMKIIPKSLKVLKPTVKSPITKGKFKHIRPVKIRRFRKGRRRPKGTKSMPKHRSSRAKSNSVQNGKTNINTKVTKQAKSVPIATTLKPKQTKSVPIATTLKPKQTKSVPIATTLKPITTNPTSTEKTKRNTSQNITIKPVNMKVPQKKISVVKKKKKVHRKRIRLTRKQVQRRRQMLRMRRLRNKKKSAEQKKQSVKKS